MIQKDRLQCRLKFSSTPTKILSKLFSSQLSTAEEAAEEGSTGSIVPFVDTTA